MGISLNVDNAAVTSVQPRRGSGIGTATRAVALLAALVSWHAQGDDVVVPVTDDLAREAAHASRGGVPLLLVLTQEHCSFCERLDRDVMAPRYASGLFDGRVLVRRVMVDSYLSTRYFDGTVLSRDELRRRFKLDVTPTVLLVDADGNELAPRITGFENSEFYGAYLDIAIDNARARLARR